MSQLMLNWSISTVICFFYNLTHFVVMGEWTEFWWKIFIPLHLGPVVIYEVLKPEQSMKLYKNAQKQCTVLMNITEETRPCTKWPLVFLHGKLIVLHKTRISLKFLPFLFMIYCIFFKDVVKLSTIVRYQDSICTVDNISYYNLRTWSGEPSYQYLCRYT